jgi:hypothetical protein
MHPNSDLDGPAIRCQLRRPSPRDIAAMHPDLAQMQRFPGQHTLSFSDTTRAAPIFALAPAPQALLNFHQVMPYHITLPFAPSYQLIYPLCHTVAEPLSAYNRDTQRGPPGCHACCEFLTKTRVFPTFSRLFPIFAGHPRADR